MAASRRTRRTASPGPQPAPRHRTGTRSRHARSAPSAQDGAHREPTVIYIHGIGVQPRPDDCKRDWDFALFGQDLANRTHLAYWADIRHPLAAAMARLRRRAIHALGDAVADLDADELADELVDAAGVTGQAKSRARAYALRLEASLAANDSRAPRGRGARGVHAQVLPFPEWIRRPITAALTKLLIRDSAAYFFNAAQRSSMRKRLIAALDAAPGPIVLVAHSQGTIIAYDVLTELAGRVPVELFVTLGSPLGITEVQDHIARPLTVPRGVRAWLNVADPFDPIALDKGLASEFAPRGFIHDRLILNPGTLRFDPHSATGYLSSPVVREAVGSAMGVREILKYGEFLRRDVLAAMRDRTSRHPVLIELRDEDAFAIPDNAPARDTTISPSRGATETVLDVRRRELVAIVERLVGKPERDAARIDPLRRFVAARLTTSQIEALAEYRATHVYCVWRNSAKRKLLHRSAAVVHVPAARTAYRSDGRGITWAVLDTGVLAKHPHFTRHRNIDRVWDCTKTGAPRRIEPLAATDRDGHGTHVAGIIAGEQQGRIADDARLVGLAPRARLHIYKVLDDQGNGDDGWIIKALDHISRTNEGSSGLVIHGVNLSLGGPFDPEVYGCGHSPICQELRRLWRQGVLACVACGNEGQMTVDTPDGPFDLYTTLTVGDPANLEECIAVGSVNTDQPHVYGVSYFSSRGPTADGRPKPDVIAPGERIQSCDTGRRGGYASMSGTSMACPHVSGLLASFLSVRREFIGRPDDVKRILLASCTDIGRDRHHQGAGIPNLVRMLAQL